MSRSYKKHSVYKDGSSSRRRTKRLYKKLANRKVRREKIAFKKSNGYRKVSESWHICDYRFYHPISPETSKEKDALKWWRKWYYRK